MRNFFSSLRKTLLSLLTIIGISLVVLLCIFGIIKFFQDTNAKDEALWQGFFCAITALLFFPVCIVLGFCTISLASGIVNQDLRWKWLLMLAPGAAVFLFGYLLTGGHAELIPVPGFLKPVFDVFAGQPDMTGPYCMLFGGTMVLMLIYSGLRVIAPVAIVKLVAGLAILLAFTTYCINGAFSGDAEGLEGIIFFLGIIFGATFTGMFSFKISDIFAHNVFGRMKPFFWLMYLLSSLLSLLGLVLAAGNMFFSDLIYNLIYEWLPGLLYDYADLLQGVNGFLLGLLLLGTGFLWLLSTVGVQGERCSNCGGYGYEEAEKLGVVSSFIAGEYIIDRSRLTSITVYSNGVHVDEYEDSQDKRQIVRYKEKEAIGCRYCGQDYGTRTYEGSYEQDAGSTDMGSHREWRIF
ncbi:MAG: hypothetical protein IKK08_02610 [Clostridia bacterium]|nr:hypothetical protein [Clostridia bacterium]